MKAVIMQPTYLPWMGYFDLLDQCDVFVFLDDVQYEKQSWQTRNKIKTPQGELWLSVPVVRKFPQLLSEVEINYATSWSKTHFKTISQNYQKAPQFKAYIGELEEVYAGNPARLIDLNIAFIKLIARRLGLADKRTVLSSTLNVSGSKVERLVKICRQLGADQYLSPLGAQEYIQADNQFPAAGIGLEYQQFNFPTYPQLYGAFVPYLSVLDLLFMTGEEAMGLIRQGRNNVRG